MSQQRTSGSLVVANCAIRYLCWGDPQHPPLLLLHGRMSHARCWAFIAPLLASKYYCVAIDSSGMGDSGHRDHYTRATRAEEVRAVALNLQLLGSSQRPILVSHSFGAVVGLDAFNNYPDAFGGLVACDPSFEHPNDWASLQPRQDGAALTRPHRTYADLASAVSRFRFAPAQVSRHLVLEEYIARHSLKPTTGGWCWKFDPLVYSSSEEAHDNWWVHHTQDFVESDAPRAIIYGDRSELITENTVDSVRERCADRVQTYKISEAAHHLMVDQPFKLAEAIDQAVAGLAISH